MALMSQLFDSLPLGVIVLSATGKVVVYNRAEERLAARKREQVIGLTFFEDVAPCMNVRQLGGEFEKGIGRSDLDVNVEFSFPFPFMDEPRDVRVHMTSFEVASDPYACLVIEDISNQRSVERMKETLQNLLVHDLKNPLSAVLANLGFLERVSSIRDNQDAQEAISDSVRAAQRLNAMLVNLLDITRLETNRLPLNVVSVEIADILVSVMENNAALAKAYGVTLRVALQRSIRAVVDPTVIRRALDNLVENAVRHARYVVLDAEEDAGVVTLVVSDDGPGIPEDLRAAIFDKYTQVVQPGAQAGYNRGLGLTFVRLAARAHGGDAQVDSAVPHGSIFRIAFPVQRAASQRP